MYAVRAADFARSPATVARSKSASDAFSGVTANPAVGFCTDLLVRAGADGLSVGRIAEALAIEANGRLTFHLKELVGAGLASQFTFASAGDRFALFA